MNANSDVYLFKYSQYFYLEIKEFIETDKKSYLESKLDDNFYLKREMGEKCEFIYEIIDFDLIMEFIIRLTNKINTFNPN